MSDVLLKTYARLPVTFARARAAGWRDSTDMKTLAALAGLARCQAPTRHRPHPRPGAQDLVQHRTRLTQHVST